MELKCPPLLLLLLSALCMWGVSLLPVSLVVAVPGRQPIAAVLAVVGIIVCAAGVGSFRRTKTTMDPRTPQRASSLVAIGIYRYSRNPMYLGFALLLAALAFWLSSLLAFLVVPAFVLYLNQYQIKPEERALAEKFGADYREYQKAARRWL